LQRLALQLFFRLFADCNCLVTVAPSAGRRILFLQSFQEVVIFIALYQTISKYQKGRKTCISRPDTYGFPNKHLVWRAEQ
jgi:hypothetical protein